nr:hypothetical protein [Tanacetum cinerariifolium]
DFKNTLLNDDDRTRSSRERESVSKVVVKLASLGNFCTMKAGRRSTRNPSSVGYCSLRVAH